MTTWKTANAVSEQGYSLVDGRTTSCELRVRDDVGGWDW